MEIAENYEETKTCDIYQAASLMASGCKLKKHVMEKGRVYFIFDNQGDFIPDLVAKYLSRQLTIDSLTLVDNIRSLKTLCAETTNNLRHRRR